MKFSTARWVTGFFSLLSAILILLFFYLQSNDMMVDIFYRNIKWVLLTTVGIVLFTAGSRLMAERNQEEEISKKSIKQAFFLLTALLIWKTSTTFLSR